ncbi:MAG: IS91 family transposase [Planctomycetota bacterium]
MTDRPEVAEVFRGGGSRFLNQYGKSLSFDQNRALRAITLCRTRALGGHVDRCDGCGHARPSYNSCRNRHCPKCQASARAAWMDARAAELLPVPYFHLVFTLPSQLGPIALQNPKAVYGILFRAAWETVRELAKDPKHLGAKVGMLSVLHTWGSNLMHHPHLHCIVPSGGVSLDGRRWVAVKRSRKRKAFFLPVRVMSHVFRGKFLQQLKAAYSRGELGFHGELKSLSNPKRFGALLNASVETDWVVYCKRPFGGPRQVLKYLARYTHRVAIANSRLVSYENGMVRFRWKDYRHGSQTKTLSLSDTEFIRRFLLHVLPAGLVRIRHHGLLANRNRKENLRRCRELLGVKESPPIPDAVATDDKEPPETLCPKCQSGQMRPSELQPIRGVSTRAALQRFAAGLDFQDSS